jgi:hypothetical protein
VTSDRLASVAAGVLGAFVVLQEISFWGTGSSLAPVLTALGAGLIAAAASHLLRKPGA